MRTIAICSMLGESPQANSITRSFRDEPVLRHTLRRLHQVPQLQNIVVLHWDDQRADCALVDDVTLNSVGARRPLPAMEAIEAAQRWTDGWRGGMLSTAVCDRGFSPAAVQQCLADHNADAAVLIHPAAGLIDPNDIARLIETAAGERSF
jgi:2-C-methyl-D-erythritol 4-phosphate cytidylyltransferase